MYPRIDISLHLVLGSDHYKDWEFPLGSLNPASFLSSLTLQARYPELRKVMVCQGYTLQGRPGSPLPLSPPGTQLVG